MSAKIERRLPFVIAILMAGVATVVVSSYEIGSLPKSLPAGTMTFGIVVAGFAATQRNMLLGMRGSTVLRFALRTGFHNDVLTYLMHCVYAGLVVSVVSVAGFFLNDHTLLAWKIWLVAIVFCISLVLVVIARNEILMARIVQRFMEDPDNRVG